MWYNMAMKILIDADGCPVVDLTLQAAAEHGLEAILFCDTSHEFKEKNARVVTVDKGSDSADFALIRQVKPGDIVVTQDYGLAAMVLAKRGIPLPKTASGSLTPILTRYCSPATQPRKPGEAATG